MRLKDIFLFFTFLFSVNSHALINGTPLEGKPDLVKLTFSNDWVCTGVYLDSETILTAAHCIVGDASLRLRQIESENDKIISAQQTRFIPHPEFKENSYWNSHDVGVIKTTPNKDFDGNFKIEGKGAGIAGHVIIYGCGKVDLKYRERRFGENSFFRIGSILFMMGLMGPNTQSSSAIIAPNDSGAPIVDKDSGEIIAIAATSTYLESLKYGLPVLTTATEIDSSNFSFIKNQMR